MFRVGPRMVLKYCAIPSMVYSESIEVSQTDSCLLVVSVSVNCAKVLLLAFLLNPCF